MFSESEVDFVKGSESEFVGLYFLENFGVFMVMGFVSGYGVFYFMCVVFGILFM